MILHAYSDLGRRLVTTCTPMASYFFPEGSPSAIKDLIIITPQSPQTKELINYKDLESIHSVWRKIWSNQSDIEIQEWRTIYQLAEEILPGTRLFRFREQSRLGYFYLLKKNDYLEAQTELNELLSAISVWQYLNQGWGFYHAAAIKYRKKAFLFAGPSGAGKSTVCELCKELGCSIIHDDHVVVWPDKEHVYRVASRSIYPESTPIEALLFLNQDGSDYLVPLPALSTAKKMMDSSYETIAYPLLQGQLLKKTFVFSASMARIIPGYELHFRKSPDFWEKINEEFGYK